MLDRDYPSLYSSSNHYAIISQRYFFLALSGNLILLVFAAVMSVVNITEPWFAIMQTATLLVSLGLTIFLAAVKPQKAWYTARALAESVKTVTWRYMMRSHPFEGNEQEASRELSKSLFKILEANKHVSEQATQILSIHQSTPKMQEIRSRSLEERKKYYEKFRIEDQHQWYIKKSTYMSNMSNRWFAALILVNIVAVFFSILRIIYPLASNWPTDIFVAIAAALMAWLQTKRFQELAASYALTSHEIGLLRVDFPYARSEAMLSAFVGDAENAFSREHTQWQARRDTA